MDEEIAHQIYRFIYCRIEAIGKSPSQREIAEACYVSKGTVSKYLKTLETWGWIGRHAGIQRNIYIHFEKRGQMFCDE